jgi:hypothetical protein
MLGSLKGASCFRFRCIMVYISYFAVCAAACFSKIYVNENGWRCLRDVPGVVTNFTIQLAALPLKNIHLRHGCTTVSEQRHFLFIL